LRARTIGAPSHLTLQTAVPLIVVRCEQSACWTQQLQRSMKPWRYWRLVFLDNWGAPWGVGLERVTFEAQVTPAPRSVRARPPAVPTAANRNQMRLREHKAGAQTRPPVTAAARARARPVMRNSPRAAPPARPSPTAALRKAMGPEKLEHVTQEAWQTLCSPVQAKQRSKEQQRAANMARVR